MMLRVENLKVSYNTRFGSLNAVDGVSFDLGEKEAFGIIGESACGKSTIALSLLMLLLSNSARTDLYLGNRVWLRGEWWCTFFPALMIFLSVVGLDLLGEGLDSLLKEKEKP